MSDARIMICVPSNGRKEIVAQCVPTVAAGKGPDDVLRCYNDGSREVDAAFLQSLGADWAMNFSGMGVDAQRRMHILDFNERRDAFTHLVFADSDSFWDVEWRSKMLAIQERHGNPLVCGYNTATHAGYKNNTFAEDDEVVWRRFCPGVSYLMTRAHVERIMAVLPDKWNFDWFIPGVLGHRCATTKTSFCDHISAGGMHHDGSPGYNGGDRALNPTPWLIEKRKEIIAALCRPK